MLLKIRDVYPKLILARTRQEEMDYEGIRIIDIPRWLLEQLSSLFNYQDEKIADLDRASYGQIF